jgi:hypothetical protein
MKVTRMSNGAVLDAIMEDRGTIVPGYDAESNSFPASTVYFECGETYAYHQLDLRLLRNGLTEEIAREHLRRFLSGLGFEAKDEDLPAPEIKTTQLSVIEARSYDDRSLDVRGKHYGDIVPGWDDNRNPFPAITTYLEIEGEPHWIVTNKLHALAAGLDPEEEHQTALRKMLSERRIRAPVGLLGLDC